MICPRCKRMLPQNAKFCNKCGMVFDVNTNQMNYQNNSNNNTFRQNSNPVGPQQMYFENPNWYKQPQKKKNNDSVIIAIGVSVVCLLGLLAIVSGGSNSDRNTENESYVTEETTEETSITEEKHVESFDVDLSEYNYITTDDLSKYAPNLVDQKVYFVAEVGQVDEEMIQINIGEGYMYTNCYTSSSYVGTVKEGDKVVICGKVEGQDSYSFLGNSAQLKECKVVAINDAVNEYELASSSDALQEYFYISEEVANNNDISKEEFISLCQKYDYEDILRNEDNYKDKYAVLDGHVDQIIEGWFGSYTIFISDNNGNKWGCTYTYKDGESKMLEGDNVTIYGILDGTQNSTTVLGKQVTMPYIKIEYFE